MNERMFEEFMQELLADQNQIRSILTFEEAGMLTKNKGLVTRTRDGDEFQITIVRSN
jgi:hypothetical protein